MEEYIKKATKGMVQFGRLWDFPYSSMSDISYLEILVSERCVLWLECKYPGEIIVLSLISPFYIGVSEFI